MLCSFALFFLGISIVLTLYIVTILWRNGKLGAGHAVSLLGISVSLATVFFTNQLQPICTYSKPITSSLTAMPPPTLIKAVTPSPSASTVTLIEQLPSVTVTVLPPVTPESQFTSTPIPPTVASTITPIQTNIPTVTNIEMDRAVYVRVEGIGAAPVTEKNEVLRERLALLAATVNAKSQLAEWISGAEIEAVTIVDQGVLTTNVIRQTVKAQVPPSRTVEERYDRKTGIAYVILEMAVDRDLIP